MRFRILGELDVTTDHERACVLGRREQRALAALLIDRGHVVPTSRLVDAVWDDEPTTRADKQLNNVIYRLRRNLASCGTTVEITAVLGGYRLNVAADDVDATMFETAVSHAARQATAGRLGEAVDTLRRGLSLWRGPALVGLGTAVLEAAATALNDQRLTAQMAYFSHLLALGRHEEVATDLVALVARHPLREDLVALLMTAQYRCGRQSDALSLYTATRARLVAEVGIEPGPALQDLHQRMLANVTDLAAPADRHPAAHGHHPTVRQLPAAAPYFTGRQTEVDLLTGLAAQAGTAGAPGAFVAIDGGAGIGKQRWPCIGDISTPICSPTGSCMSTCAASTPSVNPFVPQPRYADFSPHWVYRPNSSPQTRMIRPRFIAPNLPAGECWYCWTMPATPNRCGRYCPDRLAAWRW